MHYAAIHVTCVLVGMRLYMSTGLVASHKLRLYRGGGDGEEGEAHRDVRWGKYRYATLISKIIVKWWESWSAYAIGTKKHYRLMKFLRRVINNWFNFSPTHRCGGKSKLVCIFIKWVYGSHCLARVGVLFVYSHWAAVCGTEFLLWSHERAPHVSKINMNIFQNVTSHFVKETISSQ